MFFLHTEIFCVHHFCVCKFAAIFYCPLFFVIPLVGPFCISDFLKSIHDNFKSFHEFCKWYLCWQFKHFLGLNFACNRPWFDKKLFAAILFKNFDFLIIRYVEHCFDEICGTQNLYSIINKGLRSFIDSVEGQESSLIRNKRHQFLNDHLPLSLK